MKASQRRAIWIVAGTAVIAVGGALLVRRALPRRIAASPDPSLPAPKARKRMLPDLLVASALADLPDADTVLGEPDPRWDELLGGKLTADQWRYYERGYGTTCGVVTAAWLEAAGGPPVMINRAPPGGSAEMSPDGQHLAKGSIGAHIRKLHDGGKSLGWLRTPTTGALPDLQSGDILGTEHDKFDANGKPIKGEHVDVVLSVEPVGDELHIETADGGQTDAQGRQAAKRRTRVITKNGVVHSPGSGDAKVAWWVRTGGDDLA